MFHHLLLPTDLGDNEGRALRLAGDLARRDGARLTLLHVVQTIEHLPFKGLKGFYAQLRETAEERLVELARHPALEGVGVQRRVVYGRVAEAVVDFCDKRAVDLIVMRSHRVDPQRPGQGWATLSHKVAIVAPCPVLLVK